MSTVVDLAWNRYGKMNVRLLRVVKDSPRHEVHEFNAQILISGPSLRSSYTEGNNEWVVPTESQKNFLYVMAKKHPVEPLERWCVLVANEFLRTKKHEHIESVFIHVDRIPWDRVLVDGKEHNHCFVKGSSGTRFATMTLTRRNGSSSDDYSVSLTSGFKDLSIMKTTQSGFAGYIKDDYTTLAETQDRIMATKIYTEWQFHPLLLTNFTTAPHLDFSSIYSNIYSLTLKNFVGDPIKGSFSPSVQQTIYNIATDVLKNTASIKNITFKLPNLHYYLVNFNDFKTEVKNNNEVFLTFDGAHGEIEATIERKSNSAKL